MRHKFGLTLRQLRAMDKSPPAAAVYVPCGKLLYEVWFGADGTALRIVDCSTLCVVWTREAGAIRSGGFQNKRFAKIVELAKETRRAATAA